MERRLLMMMMTQSFFSSDSEKEQDDEGKISELHQLKDGSVKEEKVAGDKRDEEKEKDKSSEVAPKADKKTGSFSVLSPRSKEQEAT